VDISLYYIYFIIIRGLLAYNWFNYKYHWPLFIISIIRVTWQKFKLVLCVLMSYWSKKPLDAHLFKFSILLSVFMQTPHVGNKNYSIFCSWNNCLYWSEEFTMIWQSYKKRMRSKLWMPPPRLVGVTSPNTLSSEKGVILNCQWRRWTRPTSANIIGLIMSTC
jgi:hypothetical protein